MRFFNRASVSGTIPNRFQIAGQALETRFVVRTNVACLSIVLIDPLFYVL